MDKIDLNSVNLLHVVAMCFRVFAICWMFYRDYLIYYLTLLSNLLPRFYSILQMTELSLSDVQQLTNIY